jgi:hypothetical protein
MRCVEAKKKTLFVVSDGADQHHELTAAKRSMLAVTSNVPFSWYDREGSPDIKALSNPLSHLCPSALDPTQHH